MRSILALLAVSALALGSPIDKDVPLVLDGVDGWIDSWMDRIVGGVEADEHEFPFIVDIRRGSHYCAGSIISPEWVVTAAHCSEGSVSSYSLVAGDHNIVIDDEIQQTRNVTLIIKHPNYNSPLQYENDIALMKVSPPFEFNEYVQAVHLPETGFAPTQVATVAGWGALTEGGSSPSVLMKVDVPHVDDATCNVAYSGSIANSMVCYGEAGKDSCQGDSGGPIMCGANNTLCGIVSWGRGCAREGFPGVYTETSHYYNWIRDTIIPTEEDPEPLTNVTTCGGFIDSTSGRISFNVGENARAQKCVWAIQVPHDTLRLRLIESHLTPVDPLYITRYDVPGGSPGEQTRVSQVNTDYIENGGLVLLVLTITPGTPARGFTLEFYSSGFLHTLPTLTGHAALMTSSGSFSYPTSGSYSNLESALFIISPDVGGDRVLQFTRMSVEPDSQCRFDVVSVYSWVNSQYQLLDRFCGSSLPETFHLPLGAALISFTTDSSVTGSGFTFTWQ